MNAARNANSAMRYTARDGKVYEGDTAYQVVEAMRYDNAMTSGKSSSTYMTTTAERYRLYDGIEIRTDTEENFLADLVTAGSFVRNS